MKYLGIDYGTKKIGLATADSQVGIAFPKSIITNDDKTLTTIVELVRNEGIESMVIGHSVAMDGSDNPLQKKIQKFADELTKQTNLNVHMEKEWMSSIAAKSHLYGKGNIANEQWSGKMNDQKNKNIDDGAAAIILQRFLDKTN